MNDVLKYVVQLHTIVVEEYWTNVRIVKIQSVLGYRAQAEQHDEYVKDDDNLASLPPFDEVEDHIVHSESELEGEKQDSNCTEYLDSRYLLLA